MDPKTVLVIGRSGQLALALSGQRGLAYTCMGRPDLDLADRASIEQAVRALKPAAIVNAAAYTAVDKAEKEPDLAYQVNAVGPENLARVCAANDLPLLHVSTDFVFDGCSTVPYRPDDQACPCSVYGASKAAGEEAVRSLLAAHVIVRTAWVFSRDGNNFLKTMLRLGNERDSLSIVDDQRGSPTHAADLASGLHAIAEVIVNNPAFDRWGTYHMTNCGQTTWYRFAEEIFRQAEPYGQRKPALQAISTDQFPTDATRPAYSVLDNSTLSETFKIALPDWQDAVGACLNAIFTKPVTAQSQGIR
jgi:dTDP-4-dehydrorhamnose reductase